MEKFKRDVLMTAVLQINIKMDYASYKQMNGI